MPFSVPFEDSRWLVRVGQSENFSVFWKKNPGMVCAVPWSVVTNLKSKSSLFPETWRSAGGCCGASVSVLARTVTPEQSAGECWDCPQPETCQVQFSCLTLVLKQFQAVPVVSTWQSLACQGALSLLSPLPLADLWELRRVAAGLRGRVLQHVPPGVSRPEGHAWGKVHLHRV